MVIPYRSTPIFDEATLPAALRSEHRTKAGVWGVIRVIEGRLKLTYLDPASEVVLAILAVPNILGQLGFACQYHTPA